jgi:hypothetical protein
VRAFHFFLARPVASKPIFVEGVVRGHVRGDGNYANGIHKVLTPELDRHAYSNPMSVTLIYGTHARTAEHPRRKYE